MKLTKSSKEKIVAEVVNRKFDDRIKTITQKASEISEILIKDRLKGIPWKACSEFLYLTHYANIETSVNNRLSVSLKNEYPSKNRYSSHWDFKKGDDENLDKIIEAWEIVHKEKSEAVSSLWAVLNSANTTNQLFETIPEIEPIFINLFGNKDIVSLVAVETVNKVKSLLEG